MANKLMTGILVFLVVINIAMGAYMYLISQDVDTLSKQLASLQANTTAQLDDLIGDVDDLDKETAGRFDTVEEGIETNRAGIESIGDELVGEDIPRGPLEKWHEWMLEAEDEATTGIELGWTGIKQKLESERLEECAERLWKDYSIIITGHTHIPVSLHKKEKYYFNTGTWMPYADIDDEIFDIEQLRNVDSFPFEPKTPLEAGLFLLL